MTEVSKSVEMQRYVKLSVTSSYVQIPVSFEPVRVQCAVKFLFVNNFEALEMQRWKHYNKARAMKMQRFFCFCKFIKIDLLKECLWQG